MPEPPREPPYPVIANLIENGKLVFFLGAGASISHRAPDSKWAMGTADFPPLGSELAELLANDGSYPSKDVNDRHDLSRVASYYEYVAVDRDSLVDRLRKVFSPHYKPGKVHEYLAGLAKPALIVTTNYDDLIEQAFIARQKPFHLVVHPADRKDLAGAVLVKRAGESEFEEASPSTLNLSLDDTAIIYKMHGSIDPARGTGDNFVITEEDYVTFLARMTARLAIPARFELIFRRSRFLFLGYGLRDWNLRVMLQTLRQRRVDEANKADGDESADRLRSWSIRKNPSVIEEELWKAQNVTIYDLDLNDFFDRLSAAGIPGVAGVAAAGAAAVVPAAGGAT